MAGTITIYEPTAEAKKPISASIPYLNDLRDKVVGFASNEGWVCLETIWKSLGEFLTEKYQVSNTVKVPIPLARPVPPQLLDDLARKNDAVIVGLANWGACTAWSIHDTIELRKKNVPVVALVNEDFVVEAQMISRSRGMPDLKYVVFPRTINSMPPEEIKKATIKVSEDIVKLLTKPVEKPIAARQ